MGLCATLALLCDDFDCISSFAIFPNTSFSSSSAHTFFFHSLPFSLCVFVCVSFDALVYVSLA